jgi:hypothetical protein
MVALTLDKVAVFYRNKRNGPRARRPPDRANAIRAHSLASGLAQEATERLGEDKKDEAAPSIGERRRIRPTTYHFRRAAPQIEKNLTALEPLRKSPGGRRGRK